jgi:hypothetical protein
MLQFAASKFCRLALSQHRQIRLIYDNKGSRIAGRYGRSKAHMGRACLRYGVARGDVPDCLTTKVLGGTRIL